MVPKNFRPEPLNVAILNRDGTKYVRMSDIPEPYLTAFKKALYVAQVPVVEGEGDCAYAADWVFFLQRNGLR